MITGCMRPEGLLSDGFVVHLTVPTPNVRARRPERVSRSVPEVERRASRAASRPAGPRVGERGRVSAVRVGLYYIRYVSYRGKIAYFWNVVYLYKYSEKS